MTYKFVPFPKYEFNTIFRIFLTRLFEFSDMTNFVISANGIIIRLMSKKNMSMLCKNFAFSSLSLRTFDIRRNSKSYTVYTVEGLMLVIIRTGFFSTKFRTFFTVHRYIESYRYTPEIAIDIYRSELCVL